MKKSVWCVVALTLILSNASLAKADVIFQQNFDNPTGSNGQVVFRADPIYLAAGAIPSGGDKNGNTPYLNGLVLQNNNFPPFPAGGWGVIGHDQGGTGFFLYEGTNNGSAPSYVGTFWRDSSSVPVLPNTNYTFSFYLTNSTPRSLPSLNPAIVQPLINGVALGAGVSANGFFTDGISGDGWQQFTFTWNSGSATTADMSLMDLRATGDGNDFGIDTITLVGPAATVPEPSAIALLSLGGLGLAGWRRWKKRATA
jgi:PEP-CTERM motif